MRPTRRAACPNCGKELELPVSATKFVCKHCGEALRIAPDKRLFLLTPISRYTQLGSRAEDSKATRSSVDQTLNRNEERRRQFSAEMGFTRIERQKQEATRFFRVGIGLLIVGILFLLFFRYLLAEHESLATVRSTIFATVAIVDLIYIFSFKNLKRSIFRTENFFKNKFLFFGVFYGFVLTFLAIYLPSLNRILGTEPLDLSHWLLVLGIALVTTLWVEAVKYMFNRRGFTKAIK